jgi:ABC-type multidrug transport system ATPase subunit
MKFMETKDSNSIIKFSNITKKYGNFTAVSNLTLEIHRGEILGFCGPNGAGKTTTMKMLAGLLRPTSGEILFRYDHQWVSLKNSTKDTLMEQMGFLVESPTFYEHLSPRIILTYFAKLMGYPRAKIHQRVEEVVQMVEMMEWIDKPIKDFSKGMRQKIGIVAAIVHDPAVVILDEPQTGLDPKAQKEMREFILKLKELGKTVFLSSHQLYEISEIADRVAIISRGVLVACDTLESLEASAKQSVIKMEVLQDITNEQAELIIQQFTPLIIPLAGLSGDPPILRPFLHYNVEQQEFEILFDGTKDAQYQILKTLIENGLEITNYSVPKASTLERIYLQLIQQADTIANQIQKGSVQVKNML